jgi:hypothetical protein
MRIAPQSNAKWSSPRPPRTWMQSVGHSTAMFHSSAIGHEMEVSGGGARSGASTRELRAPEASACNRLFVLAAERPVYLQFTKLIIVLMFESVLFESRATVRSTRAWISIHYWSVPNSHHCSALDFPPMMLWIRPCFHHLMQPPVHASYNNAGDSMQENKKAHSARKST